MCTAEKFVLAGTSLWCNVTQQINYRNELLSNKIEIPKQKYQNENIYKTIIRPVFTYSSETWTLTAKMKTTYAFLEGKY